MILAAGFGTRLGELTAVRPKPMLPVCGAPLVRWSVLWLRAHGVREIVVNLHHLGEQIVDELGDGSELGVAIAYSHEEGLILGTGGGLRQARGLLDDGHDGSILVVNGKIVCDLDLRGLMAAHESSGREATMVLWQDERWPGNVAADRNDGGRLGMLRHEVAPGVEPGPTMMFTGIQVMQPRFLDRVPAEGEQCIVSTAHTQLFHEQGGKGVGVHVHEGYWWEHSTVERYLQGITNLLDDRARLPWAERAVRGVDPTAIIEAGVEIDARVHVGPGAVLRSGAVIGAHSQVGAGATVEAGVRMGRAAVWPGATLRADLHDGVCSGVGALP
ncbi:MAG: NDP-sugar synthase [Myxococcales bacterium]|nr:NDP-sugar synthase [Myxococcales bacterium]